MRGEQVYNLQLLLRRAVQQLDDCLLDDFHVLTPSRHDRLDLRRAEESRLICCAVSLCAPDQRAAEKRLARPWQTAANVVFRVELKKLYQKTLQTHHTYPLL